MDGEHGLTVNSIDRLSNGRGSFDRVASPGRFVPQALTAHLFIQQSYKLAAISKFA